MAVSYEVTTNDDRNINQHLNLSELMVYIREQREATGRPVLPMLPWVIEMAMTDERVKTAKIKKLVINQKVPYERNKS
jgi:hypothetical protein